MELRKMNLKDAYAEWEYTSNEKIKAIALTKI